MGLPPARATAGCVVNNPGVTPVAVEVLKTSLPCTT